MNKCKNKTEYSMSFSQDILFPEDLENERNLTLESLEWENSINPIANEEKEKKIPLEFLSEISPIAYDSNINVHDKNTKQRKFLKSDSEFSSLVNIKNKNLSSSDCKNYHVNDNSVFNFIETKRIIKAQNDIANKGKSYLFEESSKNKPKINSKTTKSSEKIKETFSDKSNSAKNERKNKISKDAKKENLKHNVNGNIKRKAKKANEEDNAKTKNFKMSYLDNIRKNKENYFAKLNFLEEKQNSKNYTTSSDNRNPKHKNKEKLKENQINNVKKESNLANNEPAYIKTAEIKISESAEEEISFIKFLNLLQKGMYSSGFFASEFNFDDFKKELEKLNISLKTPKFSLKEKLNEFKEKIQTFSEQKMENIFFYYYVSLNLILQNLVKSKVNLTINQLFEANCEQDFNQIIKQFEYQDKTNSNDCLTRYPSSTRNPITKEYIKCITFQKANGINESLKNLSNNAKKRNNQSHLINSSPLLKTEAMPSITTEINKPNNNQKVRKIQNSNSTANENIYVFKPLDHNNYNNNFNIKNKIFQGQNNLVLMPYSKNKANSVNTLNFPNEIYPNLQQITENNRYLIPARPQMIINRNPFFSNIPFDNRNKNAILSNYQPINNINPNNLIPNFNRNFFNPSLGFNSLIPIINRSYVNLGKNPQAFNNFNSLNQQSNQANNFSDNANNLNNQRFSQISESENTDYKKSILNDFNKNNIQNFFEVPIAKETTNNKNIIRQINEGKTKFCESYSLNENSGNIINNGPKLINSEDKHKNKNQLKNYKANSNLRFDENKENDDSQGNRLLGLKRNQYDNSRFNVSENSNERNLKKLKHF